MNIEPQPWRSSRPAIELDPSQLPDRDYDLATVFIEQETRARRRTILFNTLATVALVAFIIAAICAAH